MRRWVGFLLTGAWALAAGAELPPPSAKLKLQDLPDRLHAEGLAEFRVGRFSAAYGFVRSADLGHPPSAHYALWMCRHGLELFGKDWDCTGEQLHDWAGLTGVPTPPLVARHYRRYTVPAGRPIDEMPGASSTAHLPGTAPNSSSVTRPRR